VTPADPELVEVTPDPAGPEQSSSGGPRRVAALVLGGLRQLLVPALALVSALAIGAIVIVLSDPVFIAKVGSDPWAAVSSGLGAVGGAYSGLYIGAIGNPFADINPISETLLRATPLIFAGLAVALGFRAGLFNIGAEGQIYIGALFATGVGIGFTDLPMFIHLPLAVLAGFVGGAIWGFIPGILKARTGAHEVITTIMLNYVSYLIIDLALRQPFYQLPGRSDPISKTILPSAQLPRLLPDFLGDLRVHWGLILALAAAVAVWWLLFRSTKGFEFRAVGLNPSGARYAGMNISRTVVLAMMISGGLAGLAGASEMLGTNLRLTPNFSPHWGFDAIAIALLGASRPVGVVGAAILFGALRAGAAPMQVQTGIPVDLVVVIQGLVVLFIAAPALVRGIYRIQAVKKTGPEVSIKGWGA
jgi:general nucleoside transport system permease protein